MALVPGTRLGLYEITAKLGEGGMGEVWRATDTKLGREVALKLLPEGFADDPERHARFEREARTLASLNHPNIATLYGLEHLDGKHALVMELVEGEGLDEMVARGPVPLDDAIPIALQIAEALEVAHEHSIVHRDLKPANVRIRPDSTAKVLDFGLAKAWEAEAGNSSLSLSPTVTRHATVEGVILGTAAYMSPEQARGRPVDKRADIWAFGVVLWEMLTGRQMFSGETVTDVLASVLKTEIDFAKLPSSIPAAIRRLLRRLLERNPKDRLHDIADARIMIGELVSGRVEESDAPSVGSSDVSGRWRRLPWILAATTALATLAALAMASILLRPPRAEPAPALRLEVTPPEFSSPTNRGGYFELSPDGRFLLMVEDGELWVRPLDAMVARRMEGIEDASYPFWSPDGAWIGFFAGGELRKVARDGGRAQTVCAAPDGRGATWSPEGVILFSDHFGDNGLSRVSALGGAPVAVTETASRAGIEVHRYPQFLPDGKSFLFLDLAPSPKLSGVYLGTLGGGKPERVLEGSDQAIYARAKGNGDGFLFYRRDKTLMAQPFDLARRRTSGEPIPVADGVGLGGNTGSGAFTLSDTGLLASSAGTVGSSELVWFDRSGKRGERLGIDGVTGEIVGLSLARGGKRVAFGLGDPPEIFVQSIPGGEPSRFTFGPSHGWMDPIWSPDGSEIAYATQDLAGLGVYELRRRRADRTGTEETLVKSKEAIYPWDWSPDGRSILYGDWGGNLWLLPLEGERTPVAYATTHGNQPYGQFSPDGRLIAYSSDEQGRSEVFVATVPQSGALWQISTGGGSMPRWRLDGRELYFRAKDGTLMAVPLGSGPGTAALEGRGAPRPLIPGIPSPGNSWIFTYVPSEDGQRFLVAAARRGARRPITVLVNWQTTIAQRAHGDAP